VYGQKVDLMLLETKHDFELCSAELKKRNVSVDILRNQQTKNLRVSKCMLTKISGLELPPAELETLSIDIMDWRGKC
jgi:hypothetical protein